MRSELEADVTEMMNRVHPGVNSRFSPEAILIFRKIARGWGGISESPPWDRNEPTGSSGPLGSPHQVRGRMPCDHGTHLPRVSGSSELTTDVIQIAPARGRAVHPMAAASGRPGPTGPPGGYCRTLPATEWVLGGYIHRCFCLLSGKEMSISRPENEAEEEGPAAEEDDPAYDHRGWHAPGHHQANGHHWQARGVARELLASPRTVSRGAAHAISMRRA